MRNSETSARLRRGYAVIGMVIVLLAPQGAAAQSNELETRLRDALRTAVSEKRALEDENASLRAKEATAEAQLQDATAKAAALAQQIATLEQTVAADAERERTRAQSLATAESGLDASRHDLEDARASLGKWQGAYKEAAEVARTRDADAKRLAAELGQTTGRAEACETKNAELFKLGNEILAMYEAKGPLTGLLEREPITGLKRVQLENLMQDYQDKLHDQKLSTPAQ